MGNNLTKGDFSPIINGNDNKIKVSFCQKMKYGSIGFIVGVLASLLANLIWSMI